MNVLVGRIVGQDGLISGNFVEDFDCIIIGASVVGLAGGVRLSSDDEYLKLHLQDYSVDPLRRLNFYDSVRKFIPFISEGDLYPDTAGIRPKLQGRNDNFRDFIVSDEADKGLPGFINLIGIESPGLTASLAISRYVREKVSLYS